MPAGLNSSDMKQILGFGRTVMSCNDCYDLRRASLDLMSDMFGCDSGNFFLTASPQGRLNLADVVSVGITRQDLDRFHEHYYRLDPFLKHFPPVATVQTMDQVAPEPRLESGEYYNDFLKPQNIHHQMTIAVQSKGRIEAVIALFRPRRSRNFNAADRAKAELCALYLAGTLEKITYADQALKRQRAAETLAAGLPCRGVVVADEDTGIIYSSQEADRLLGAVAKPAVLPDKIARACLEVLERGRDEPYRLLAEMDGDNRPVAVSVRLATGRNKDRFLLISLDDNTELRDQARLLKEKGISRREFEVAGLVAAGLSNAETARRLYLSEYTIENHLKNIFRKLGVKSRTQLAAVMQSARQ